MDNFLQMPETTSGTVSEHIRHVSMLDDRHDTQVILYGLHGLVTAIVN